MPKTVDEIEAAATPAEPPAEKPRRGRKPKTPPAAVAAEPVAATPDPKPVAKPRKPRAAKKKTTTAAELKNTGAMLGTAVMHATNVAIMLMGRHVEPHQVETLQELAAATGDSLAAVLDKYDVEVSAELSLVTSAVILGGSVWALPTRAQAAAAAAVKAATT